MNSISNRLGTITLLRNDYTIRELFPISGSFTLVNVTASMNLFKPKVKKIIHCCL